MPDLAIEDVEFCNIIIWMVVFVPQDESRLFSADELLFAVMIEPINDAKKLLQEVLQSVKTGSEKVAQFCNVFPCHGSTVAM